MSALVAFSAIILLGQSSAQQTVREIQNDDRARLQACIDKIETDADDAYEDSLAWLAEGSRPPARHCRALALIALGQLEDGAAKLESLAAAPDAGSLDQRALYLSQASSAWLQAGAFEAATVSLSEAIRLRPSETSFYIDRALANIALKNFIPAREDLNEALGREPDNSDAYRLRAQVNLNEERFTDAVDDIEQALAIDPLNVDVALLRGEIREAIRLNAE
ncbi:MAG: tetratricopeptide repeat protein [Pseudomonadota bacterium]